MDVLTPKLPEYPSEGLSGWSPAKLIKLVQIVERAEARAARPAKRHTALLTRLIAETKAELVLTRQLHRLLTTTT